MKNVFKDLNRYKKFIVSGPLFKLIEAIIEVSLPFLIANIIDNIVAYNVYAIIKNGFFMIILVILGFIFACSAQYSAAKTSQGFGTCLRNKLFKHISTLSYSTLDKFGNSSLVNRITNDTINLEIGIAMFIRLVVRVPFLCICSIIMVYLINPHIGFILLISTIFVFICTCFIIFFASKLNKKSSNILDKISHITKENLSNIKIVRSFIAEPREKEKFNIQNTKHNNLSQKSIYISSLLSPIATFLLDISIVLVLYFSYNTIDISKGNLIAITNYISQMIIAIIVLSNLIIIYTKFYTSYTRIAEILNTKSDKKNGTLTSFNSTDIAINFENVDFSYNKTVPFFSCINLKIKTGSIIGIIRTNWLSENLLYLI